MQVTGDYPKSGYFRKHLHADYESAHYRERRRHMARGQRKTLEEKITAKEELIDALMTRVESEKRELEELYQEKRIKELEAVSELIEDSGLQPEEVAAVLQQYLESREEAVS